jgi:hypothetical protein
VGSLARFALAPQWESICGVGFLDGLARQDKTETIANENPDPEFTLNSDRHDEPIEIAPLN